ncbi:hypothetical protein AB4851_15755 [Burkholderia sp. 22PA0099]|uniref:hypothetical protein n=1 Tax=Burkholderia sp. 22PA0099 TaxID=3237372 RepID=UPI0039C282D6
MTISLPVRSLLRLRLALTRFGAGPLVAGAALLGAVLLWLGLLPGMAAQVDDATRAATRLAAAPPPKPAIPPAALAADRLAGFYRGLGDSTHTGEIVQHLFEAAAAAGVTLDKAEYKPGHDGFGRFDTYTVVLPVKGDYARLRRFGETVLAAVPYAALDDMRFKRSSAEDAGVEANLRFTAFLRPVAIAPLSASEAAAIEAGASTADGASTVAVASAVSGASAVDTTGRVLASGDGFVPLPVSDAAVGAVGHPATVVSVNAQPRGADAALAKGPVTLPGLAVIRPVETRSAQAKGAVAPEARAAEPREAKAQSPEVRASGAHEGKTSLPVAGAVEAHEGKMPSPVARAAEAHEGRMSSPVTRAAETHEGRMSSPVARAAETHEGKTSSPVARAVETREPKPVSPAARSAATREAEIASPVARANATHEAKLPSPYTYSTAKPEARTANAANAPGAAGVAMPVAVPPPAATARREATYLPASAPAALARSAVASTEPAAPHPALGGSARMANLAAQAAVARPFAPTPASSGAARPFAPTPASSGAAYPTAASSTSPASSSSANAVHVIDLHAQSGGSTRTFASGAVVTPAALAAAASASDAASAPDPADATASPPGGTP